MVRSRSISEGDELRGSEYALGFPTHEPIYRLASGR